MFFPSYKILKISTRQGNNNNNNLLIYIALFNCKVGNCACAEIVTPLSAHGFRSVYSRFISLGVSFALMTFFTFEKVTFWVDWCLSKNITSFVFKSLDHWHQI